MVNCRQLSEMVTERIIKIEETKLNFIRTNKDSAPFFRELVSDKPFARKL